MEVLGTADKNEVLNGETPFRAANNDNAADVNRSVFCRITADSQDYFHIWSQTKKHFDHSFHARTRATPA